MDYRHPTPKYNYISPMKTLPLQELKTINKNSLVLKVQIQYELMCL